jgi:glyoxylase-like metal-dependent hydrolase (beta-lactamase superfamily II)
MQTYTIHPLAVGFNETDQGIMTYLRSYGKRIILPIYSFAIMGGAERILVDTGLEDFMVPSGLEERIGFRVMHFEDALQTIGWTPEDVDVIIHTHLHNDHCENDHLCTNAVVYVQKDELEFLRNPHPVDHRYYPDVLDDVTVETIEGQSVGVRTTQGKAVITGLCCNAENFPATGGVIAPGVHLNLIEAYESMQRIQEIADIIVPIHDLNVGVKGTIP